MSLFLFRPASRLRRAFLPVLFLGLKVSCFELFGLIIIHEITARQEIKSEKGLQSLIKPNLIYDEGTKTFIRDERVTSAHICIFPSFCITVTVKWIRNIGITRMIITSAKEVTRQPAFIRLFACLFTNKITRKVMSGFQ